jgi:hypothetical protein
VAWSVLFAALFSCCGLAVGVPTAGLAFVNNATIEASSNVKLQAGILQAYSQFESVNDARVVSLEGRALTEGSTVVTGPESVGLLTLGESATTDPLLTFQLYSNASLRLDRMRLPRFNTGATADEFQVRLGGGRIQIVTQPNRSHRFNLRVNSDFGSVLISTPGAYSFEQTDSELRVSVTDGQAIVSTSDNRTSFTFSGGQRTAVSAENGIAGALPAFRNLIKNGDFQPPLDRDWKIETRVDAGSTVSGTATVIGEGASAGLLLQRVGAQLGWGRTGVTQVINEDVRDRRSLTLRIDFQLIEQEIPVCGGEGSECPLFVRIDYRTKDGGDAARIQGFYGRGTPSSTLPDYIRANVQGKHVARRFNFPETFEWNLSEFLPEMQTIKSISIYAEGHQVRTQVNSVELLLQD